MKNKSILNLFLLLINELSELYLRVNKYGSISNLKSKYENLDLRFTKRCILTLLLNQMFFEFKSQDTTKYKISLGVGYSNSYFLEANKKEIALTHIQQYRERDGKFKFDYSDNVQIGFFRKLIDNLYLGLQYNFIAGRYSAVNGSKYNYIEYTDFGLPVDVQPRYISLYSAHVFNLSAQYRFNIKLNQRSKIYIQPSLGYGLGLVRRLNQTMIEYDTREEQALTGGFTYYTRTVTDRFQNNTDINNKLTNGFNTTIELGYSFKQFDFCINYNINKLRFTKGSRFETVTNNGLSHVLDWTMLSVAYRF